VLHPNIVAMLGVPQSPPLLMGLRPFFCAVDLKAVTPIYIPILQRKYTLCLIFIDQFTILAD